MPTDSRRELVVQALVTHLQTVTAGSTYFNSFATVDRKVRDILSVLPTEMPLVMAVDETENKEPSSNVHDRSTLPMSFPFVRETPLGGATASTDGNRIILDIERALIAFHETDVSGTTVSVLLQGSTKVLTELQVNDPPHLPLVVGEVRADVTFRSQTSDPGAS